MEGTESSRQVRGASETAVEYIFELCTEGEKRQVRCGEGLETLVGCSGLARVIRAGVLTETH